VDGDGDPVWEVRCRAFGDAVREKSQGLGTGTLLDGRLAPAQRQWA
jgi:hypothetical protein